MKCEEIQEWFGEYWDLPKHDLRRKHVEGHIASCPACAEEFHIWQESSSLIKADMSPWSAPSGGHVSVGVMDRIYADESWRIPIPERTYRFSYKTRRNLSAVIAFFLTLFIYSFVYSVITDFQPVDANSGHELTSMFPVNSIEDSHSITSKSSILEGVPVASISAPSILKLEPPDRPHYFLALSIFGIVFALLTMNWLSRTKA